MASHDDPLHESDDAPVFVTGGTGFVGAAVISQLLANGRTVHALVRNKSVDDHGGRVKSFVGELSDADALDRAMAQCGAVIHLVGIIKESPSKGVTFEKIHVEGTRSVVDIAKRAGIRRYVHMSAQGTRADAVSEYHRTKWQAEEIVRGSGLDWTIFRPSLIHGPRGEFIQMATKWARHQAPPYLFMPYFGAGALGRGGAGKLQPIFVEDVARAFVDALKTPVSIGGTYAIGGADVVTWPEMLRAISEVAIGKRRAVMPIPAWYAKLLTKVVPGSLLPFNASQVTMSQEDNTTDLGPFVSDFGWRPRGFRESLSVGE